MNYCDETRRKEDFLRLAATAAMSVAMGPYADPTDRAIVLSILKELEFPDTERKKPDKPKSYQTGN